MRNRLSPPKSTIRGAATTERTARPRKPKIAVSVIATAKAMTNTVHGTCGTSPVIAVPNASISTPMKPMARTPSRREETTDPRVPNRSRDAR
jgi:hypothetical protein